MMCNLRLTVNCSAFKWLCAALNKRGYPGQSH